MNFVGNKMRKICEECGVTTGTTALYHHVRKYHNMTPREYQVKHGHIPTKTCEVCSSDISLRAKQTRFCSSACRQKQNVIDSHKKFPVDSDYVECAICSLRARTLTSHIWRIHQLSISDYKRYYNAKICSKDMVADMSNNIRGEKNPGYQHGGQFSALSKNFHKYSNLSEDEKTQNIINVAKKIGISNKFNGNNSRTLAYWQKHTNTLEEAKEKLSQHQAWFSKEICIEKYGYTEGLQIWQNRQDRWQNTLLSKSREELDDINKRKLPHGYFVSKGENAIYARLSEYYADKEIEQQFTLKGNGRYYIFDIKCGNKIIEYNGDFWHMNPKIYDSETVNRATKRKAFEQWELDKAKIAVAKNQGYQVFVVWENDYKTFPDITLSNLCRFIEYG